MNIIQLLLSGGSVQQIDVLFVSGGARSVLGSCTRLGLDELERSMLGSRVWRSINITYSGP